jgi:hypothetical protein
MTRPIGYHALFGEEGDGNSGTLARELELLLAVHPAPQTYRQKLRAQLLNAANDEGFYSRRFTRRMGVAMTVVVAIGLAVAGLIAWRSQWRPLASAATQP